MDELTEHAEKHCSHLTKDNYYWLVAMVNALTDQSSGVPSFYHSRYCLYETQGIPRAIYEMLDGQAFHTAMKKTTNAQAARK